MFLIDLAHLYGGCRGRARGAGRRRARGADRRGRSFTIASIVVVVLLCAFIARRVLADCVGEFALLDPSTILDCTTASIVVVVLLCAFIADKVGVVARSGREGRCSASKVLAGRVGVGVVVETIAAFYFTIASIVVVHRPCAYIKMRVLADCVGEFVLLDPFTILDSTIASIVVVVLLCAWPGPIVGKVVHAHNLVVRGGKVATKFGCCFEHCRE
jgi:hypothetical protein